MPNIPRYLITTADERTWKFDRPVLFLGNWCLNYSRIDIWQNMNAIVAAPYGLGLEQKDADHSEARALEDKLFPILCDVLNNHHGTQHSQRFWRIVLGIWFRNYVEVILNRVKTLELCLKTYQINGTSTFVAEYYSLAPLDSYESILAFSDDRWNNALYCRILNLLGPTTWPVDVIAGDASKGYSWHAKATIVPFQRRIFSWSLHQIRKITKLLVRDKDAFIINSYLPKKEEIKFQLFLRQFPQLWVSPKPELASMPDCTLRYSCSNQIRGKSDNTLFGIMCSLVFELLPVCYLEGFAELNEKIDQLPWPKKPKFIFTSNNFVFDEVFKLWTAIKVESGIKYIAGQHGNNYGTHRYMHSSIEELTADKFLTWGWTDGLTQQMPAFIFKTAGIKDGSSDAKGGLLLIENLYYIWEKTNEFDVYFAHQIAFIEKLQKPLRKKLTIRLHRDHTNYKMGEKDRWKDFDNTIKVDTGFTNLRKLVSQSRLVIHSYDSTGILETLSQNIPSVAFWQNGFDHLRDNAKPYYQLLVDVGIIHLTPESAAAKVNEVWDNTEGWWKQNAIQDARKRFCEQYAKTEKFPITILNRILDGC